MQLKKIAKNVDYEIYGEYIYYFDAREEQLLDFQEFPQLNDEDVGDILFQYFIIALSLESNSIQANFGKFLLVENKKPVELSYSINDELFYKIKPKYILQCVSVENLPNYMYGYTYRHFFSYLNRNLRKITKDEDMIQNLYELYKKQSLKEIYISLDPAERHNFYLFRYLNNKNNLYIEKRDLYYIFDISGEPFING